MNKKEDKELRYRITELGNPRRPEGEFGQVMLDGMNEHHAPVTEWGLSFLKVPEDAVLLDIGCGGGAALARLGSLFPEGRLCGIDYSDVSVRKTCEYNKGLIADNRLEVLKGSVEAMPFEDEMFDGIITVESFYFWPDPGENLKEVRRVLKKGGAFLLIADIHGGNDLGQQDIENIRRYGMFNPSPEEFTSMMKDAGFSYAKAHLREGQSWICVEAVR